MMLRWLFLGAVTFTSGGAVLAACGGSVESTPFDAGTEDASPLVVGDASSVSVGDAGSPPDAAPPSCPERAWPSMLAAPIVPLKSIANLDWNHDGAGAISLAYAESVNCPSSPLPANYDDASTAAWGPDHDVSFDYGDDAPHLLSILYLTGKYTGTVTFRSRPGGAFGTHQYEIGVGKMLRDGAPFVIDWAGTSATVVTPAAIAGVSELFDGILATFAPSYPAESDCYATRDCIIVPDDLASESNDGGVPSRAIIGFRPLKLYFEMPVGSSVPSDGYTFLTGGPDLQDPPPADAGSPPGADAGGGLTLPAGCAFMKPDLYGSCAHPRRALCQDKPGWSLSSCRDYPQSGYVATCCPPDGG